MTRLDDTALAAALHDLSGGWTCPGGLSGALRRSWRFPDFASALAFVVAVGELAEQRGHHPDVELGWGRVVVAWTTHDAGGVTNLDIDAARACDALATRRGLDAVS